MTLLWLLDHASQLKTSATQPTKTKAEKTAMEIMYCADRNKKQTESQTARQTHGQINGQIYTQTDTQTGRHTYSRTDRQTDVQESCRQQKGGEGVGGLSAISNFIILKQNFASPDPLPFSHKPTSRNLPVCVALIFFTFTQLLETTIVSQVADINMEVGPWLLMYSTFPTPNTSRGHTFSIDCLGNHTLACTWRLLVQITSFTRLEFHVFCSCSWWVLMYGHSPRSQGARMSEGRLHI